MRLLPDSLEKYLIAALLAVIAVLMLLEALCRHLWPGLESLPLKAAGGCLAWMASIGMARAAAVGAHLRVTVLEELLPEKLRRCSARFADLAFLVFSIFSLMIGGAVFFLDLTRKSLPGNPLVYAAIPVGSALTVVRLLERLRRGGSGEDA